MVKCPARRLDYLFGALADPTRRGILERLRKGECSVTQLGAPFPISAPAISKHLRVLERAGLIRRRKQSRTRYCRLIAEPLHAAAQWLTRFQHFWPERGAGSAQEADVAESTDGVKSESGNQSL